jgi:hypothetical protein
MHCCSMVFGGWLLEMTPHDFWRVSVDSRYHKYNCKRFFCSYLHYGLLAARAEVLKAGNANGYSNCMLEGYQGMFASTLLFTIVLSLFVL